MCVILYLRQICMDVVSQMPMLHNKWCRFNCTICFEPSAYMKQHTRVFDEGMMHALPSPFTCSLSSSLALSPLVVRRAPHPTCLILPWDDGRAVLYRHCSISNYPSATQHNASSRVCVSVSCCIVPPNYPTVRNGLMCSGYAHILVNEEALFCGSKLWSKWIECCSSVFFPCLTIF